MWRNADNGARYGERGMLGKRYIRVRVTSCWWVSSEFSIWGGILCMCVCVCVCVCVCTWKGHKHTHTHTHTHILTIHQQLFFSIANPQSFGEVLVTPMGKMLWILAIHDVHGWICTNPEKKPRPPPKKKHAHVKTFLMRDCNTEKTLAKLQRICKKICSLSLQVLVVLGDFF